MKKHHFRLLFALFIIAISCNSATDSNSGNNSTTISLRNSEVYEYHTGIDGDEEGASIVVQARHFEISEIIRNAETRWEAVYKYKPKFGYRGPDYVEIETRTGSDGASPPTTIQRIRLNFQVY